MILKKIVIFLMLAFLFYLIGSFINWELDFANWGGGSRFLYILGAVLTASNIAIEDL